MPPHLEFSSTEVEVDSANKFFFTELAFGKEREDTTALVCAESAEANGATHANMAPVAIIATDVEIISLNAHHQRHTLAHMGRFHNRNSISKMMSRVHHSAGERNRPRIPIGIRGLQ